jgi:hypothetical protein
MSWRILGVASGRDACAERAVRKKCPVSWRRVERSAFS